MNIKTTLTHYRFNLTDAAQREEYNALVNGPLAAIGFPVWTMECRYHDYNARKPVQDFIEKVGAAVGRKINTTGLTSGPVELETDHLFDNQWNSAEPHALRLFNWAEAIYNNRDIREGYFLAQTDEMREILRNTNKCGYCGAQEPAAKGYVFCPHCLDSEYLTLDSLHLTRMAPVRDTSKPRAELSEAERAHLIPQWEAAQLHGATERGKARIRKQCTRIETEYKKTVADAKEKRDAARWIMRHCPQMLENWIFYAHTGKHCFGWRKPLDAATVSRMLDIISEFPFGYTLECADGRKLEGEA